MLQDTISSDNTTTKNNNNNDNDNGNDNNNNDNDCNCCGIFEQICYYISPKFTIHRSMRSTNLLNNLDKAYKVPTVVQKVLADASRLKDLSITKQVADLKALHGLEDSRHERTLLAREMHKFNLRYKDETLEHVWWDYRSEKAMTKNRYYSGFFAVILLLWTILEFFSISINISMGYFDGFTFNININFKSSFTYILFIIRFLMFLTYFIEWVIFRVYYQSAIKFARYVQFCIFKLRNVFVACT